MTVTNPFSLNLLDNKSIDEKLLRQTFKNPQEILNLAHIFKDILQGDGDAARRKEYSYLNIKEISTALQWLQENGMSEDLKQLILSKPYSLVFKEKPPTPEEFLGPKYIGTMNEFLWEPVKEKFIEFLDPMRPYRSGIWNTSIGSGKAQPLDSKIYETEKKWFYMGDAKIGQKILTPFGDQSTILKINPQGLQPVYKIRTSDGREVKCNLQHLWTISYRKKENGEKIWETHTTEFLLQNKSKYKFEILTKDSNDKNNYFKDDDSLESFKKIKESLIIHE
jgi:hypothetical protein